ncbi:hypothetical protein ACIBH1_05420 [Nonomuraea sp. NPDC050663]|uniref:hypothetical protein n=1 Tax=Nonomuraea sp. NPDC050663 TaxID=3364370 RepID=UPI0037981269
MPLPQPDDFGDMLRSLDRGVRAARTSASTRPPITTASEGMVLPSRGTPPPPASGGRVYASGTQPYWTDSSGSTYSLKPPTVPQAGYVAATSVSLSGAPGAYSQSHTQDLVDAIEHLAERLDELIFELKSSAPPIVDPIP